MGEGSEDALENDQRPGRRDRSAGEGAEWNNCTTSSETNELLAPFHNRMPVILPRELWVTGLGEKQAGADELQALLKPFPAEHMRAYPVSAKVNSVKNDEPSLIEPAV